METNSNIKIATVLLMSVFANKAANRPLIIIFILIVIMIQDIVLSINYTSLLHWAKITLSISEFSQIHVHFTSQSECTINEADTDILPQLI